jgi:hypothetical protein
VRPFVCQAPGVPRQTPQKPTGGTDEAPAALFRSWDSHLLASIAAFVVGVLGGGGGGSSAGAAANVGSLPPQLPRWILVETDALGVRLFASNRSGAKGGQLLEAGQGTFRASLHRNVGQIQLMLFVPEERSVALKGRWGPFRRGPIRVARAVVGLAKAT